MKKIYSLCLSALVSASAFAQTQPDRVIVYEKSGNRTGFLAERVDSITFPKLEGSVAAKLAINKQIPGKDGNPDTLMVNIERTPNCTAYKLFSVPEVLANRLTDDAAMANYVDKNTDNLFFDNFENGQLVDPSWDADVKYILTSVGYDQYGIPCGVTRVPFKTTKPALVGNPKVKTVIDDIQIREFSCSFFPNQDVEGFAVVAGEAGTMQAQYEQFAPMMGFKNFGQMIKAWGYKDGEEETGHTWTKMTPNTDYEVFVQAWDKNGTFADCDTIKLKTKALGGEGVADVKVALGEYKLADWWGEMKPSQVVTYTPNDQTGSYRFIVELAKNYDANPESYKEQLPQEPPMPMENWFFYEAMTTDYQIDPNTDFVVLTAARNGVGVWSEVKVERFKTPEKVEGEAPAVLAPQSKIGTRKIKNNTYYVQPGVVPTFFKTAGKGLKMTLK